MCDDQMSRAIARSADLRFLSPAHETLATALVRKGVSRSQGHPPGSAIAREGNLWGESAQSGFLTGQNVHRLTRGVTLTS
jgi:hypothetical protein